MCFLLDKVKLPGSRTSRSVSSLKTEINRITIFNIAIITMQVLPTSLEGQSAPLVLKSLNGLENSQRKELFYSNCNGV